MHDLLAGQMLHVDKLGKGTGLGHHVTPVSLYETLSAICRPLLALLGLAGFSKVMVSL